MASLSPASKKALANLRAYTSPTTHWYKCPLTRRAAVLILLFADRKGDLRVVLTIRSAGLKNYAGQAALPGGKADTLSEHPFTVARREAFEEIGLPLSSSSLPTGYTVEHLTELPANLAMTELGVRPCVAYLRSPVPSPQNRNPDVGKDILPKLDAREVAAVFTAPFRGFLREKDAEDPTSTEGEGARRAEGEWYRGSWHSWHESAWRMHQFFVPVTRDTVFLADPQRRREQQERFLRIKSEDAQKNIKEKNTTGTSPVATISSTGSSSRSSSSLIPPLPRTFYTVAGDALAQPRYRVFGMTARILVDCARVAYAEEPEFEHNSHFGDEEMIARLLKIGRLSSTRKEGEVLTREVMQRAKEAKI